MPTEIEAFTTEPFESPTLLPAPPSSTDAQLDVAVAWLNRAVRDGGLQVATQVSDYVLATFFAGDIGQLSSPDRTKAHSFNALCRRPDLEMGAATLRRLVRVGIQVRQLPQDVAHRLSPGHHRALLVVDDPSRKAEVARVALAEGWTAQQLTTNLQAHKAAGPGNGAAPGRPTKPELVKASHALRGRVQALLNRAGLDAEFGGLSSADKAAVVEALRETRDALEMVMSGLGA